MRKTSTQHTSGFSFSSVLNRLKRNAPEIFYWLVDLRSKTISDAPWPAETKRIMKLMPKEGIFLTGIESSDPYVNNTRRNQLKEAFDFEANYVERLTRIRALDITWLRYGPPLSQANPAKNQYDFDLTDKVTDLCNEYGMEIIMDLLHFGLPDWMHAENPDQPYFQNPLFPQLFAQYVETVVRRYPQLRYFTLVNEPYVTAHLSAKVGAWNEARKSDWHDDTYFVRAVSNIARAAILGKKAVENVWKETRRSGEPIFVQNESFEVAYAETGSSREAEAAQFNTRRFAALDLLFGHTSRDTHEYLIKQGMPESEYKWFMEHGNSQRTILGIDHYPWCVYKLGTHTEVTVNPLEQYQLYELTKVYWGRYKLPLLHTEINGIPELAIALCQKTYDMLSKLSDEGYPVLGMGWYGDEYQVGWQSLLAGNDEYPVGLHYRGQPQPVAELFTKLQKQGLRSVPSGISFFRRR